MTEELYALGLAALLHDIGILLMSDSEGKMCKYKKEEKDLERTSGKDIT